jgi:hypothetical protein
MLLLYCLFYAVFGCSWLFVADTLFIHVVYLCRISIVYQGQTPLRSTHAHSTLTFLRLTACHILGLHRMKELSLNDRLINDQDMEGLQ